MWQVSMLQGNITLLSAKNTELNDLKIIVCLRKSEVSVQRISAVMSLNKLAEHSRYYLSCSYITNVINLFPNVVQSSLAE